MSSSSPRAPRGPFHWVLDWDGTITQKDTLDTLVHIAAYTKPEWPTHDRWQAAVDAYLPEYTNTLESLAPDNTLPRTVAEEIELLKALKPVEQRSIDGVSSSQIFAGLTQDIIHQGAQDALSLGLIKLRPGIQTFFQRFPETNILSVNWSRHFIASCVPVSQTRIFANELDGITQNKVSKGAISPGPEDMKIIASDDKLRYFEQISSTTSLPTAYVGDSWPDIECLLAAELGICIRDEPMGNSQNMLADALERLGVACPRLRELQHGEAAKVVWAQDFEEILAWVDQRNGDGHT